MVSAFVMRTFAIAAAAALIVTTGSADAVEIDAMITTAMKAAIEETRAAVRTRQRTRAPCHLWTLRGLARRLNGGEPADLIVVQQRWTS